MDKAEFGSDEWLDIYRKNNEELVGNLPPELYGVTWSLCPRFTDPPAHLADDSGTVNWWISIVVPHVEVGRGERPDLSNHFSDDYQTARRGVREPLLPNLTDEKYAEYTGDQMRRSKEAGLATTLPPPELRALLVEAHDYMAEHTL